MEEHKTLERRSPSPPPQIPQSQIPDSKLTESEEEAILNAIQEIESDQEPEEEEEEHENDVQTDAAKEEEEEHENDVHADAVEAGQSVLTDELRDQIVRQVEYYFSDENLPNDKFLLKHVKKDHKGFGKYLLKHVKKDHKGFVSIGLIASFKNMKKLVKDISLIASALKTSSKLVVSKDERSVRRLHPLPKTLLKDPKACTVIVENLPDDCSKESLRKIFANAGKILNITIHNPHSTDESKLNRGGTIYSTKLHALIEYETTEAAATAVNTYNDEKNWRSGMRVELLQKWMGKYGVIGKRQKDSVSKKSSHNQLSEMASDGDMSKSDNHHNEKSEKEDEDLIADGKGKRRNRYRSRGKGQHNTSGLGHGQAHSSSGNGVSKPPPGPKIPDGTRGFAMGRGKSSVSPPS